MYYLTNFDKFRSLRATQNRKGSVKSTKNLVVEFPIVLSQFDIHNFDNLYI